MARKALITGAGAAGGIGTLAFETPSMPDMKETLLMVGAGATAVAGHFLIYVAYRMADARTVAPFMYTLTIWAVLSKMSRFRFDPGACVEMKPLVMVGRTTREIRSHVELKFTRCALRAPSSSQSCFSRVSGIRPPLGSSFPDQASRFRW